MSVLLHTPSGAQLLFGWLNTPQSQQDALKAEVQSGGAFRTQIEVVDPTLRMLMGLKEGEEAFHDIQMSLTKDPVTLQPVFILSTIDVTPAVLAKRELQEAHGRLAEEKLRTEALLHRQVGCLKRWLVG